MENELLNFILCLIEYSAITVFLHKLLIPRFSTFIPDVLAVLACSLIVNMMQDFSPLKMFVCVATAFVSSAILFRAKPYVILAFSTVYMYMICIIDVVSGNILSLLLDKQFLEVFYSDFGWRIVICLTVKAIDILLLLLLYRVFRRTGLDLDKTTWILFDVVMLVFLVVTVMYMTIYPTTVQNTQSSLLYTAVSVSFLLMSIIVIHFFTSICTSYRQKEKMLLLQKSYDEVEERLLVQKQNADKLRKIRHDIRNHLINTRILIEKGEEKAAAALIDDVIGQTESINLGISRTTGDNIVDTVISYKAAICENKSIAFECELSLLPEMKIDYADISSVISNLMDNAIEAAEKSENPFIKLKLTEHGAYIDIFVKNTFRDAPSSENKRLFTIKTDAENHGFGTQIIKDISEKYDGAYSWKTDSGFFLANVMLKNI